MPIAHGCVCGLCGVPFAIVLPPDEPERDKPCGQLREAGA